MLLISLSLFFQLSPTCSVYITWMVHKDEWQVALQLLFCEVLLLEFVQNTQHFSSKHFVRVLQPYNSTNTATAWKKSCFILSEPSDFPMVNNLSIAVHVSSLPVDITYSWCEIVLLRYGKHLTFRSKCFHFWIADWIFNISTIGISIPPPKSFIWSFIQLSIFSHILFTKFISFLLNDSIFFYCSILKRNSARLKRLN